LEKLTLTVWLNHVNQNGLANLLGPEIDVMAQWLVSGAENWRGVAGLRLRPVGALFLPVQVLDSGRNDFGFKLWGVIASSLAVMQVAIDLDEPAFGAFLNYLPRQFPESDDGVPFDVFFFAKLAFGGHAE
jgi:hypothetical protein